MPDDASLPADLARDDKAMWATEQAAKLLRPRDLKDPAGLPAKLRVLADAFHSVAFMRHLP
jgi:hypothetical protein